MNKQAASRAGATLVEFLVCAGIIALLVGLMVPGVQMAREAVDRVVQANDEYQTTIAQKVDDLDGHGSITETGEPTATAPTAMRAVRIIYIWEPGSGWMPYILD